MFLADINMALVKLRNNAFVGMDETAKCGTKGGETTFEPFHCKDFHEFGKVALALDFKFLSLPCVIQKRCVTCVFKFMS